MHLSYLRHMAEPFTVKNLIVKRQMLQNILRNLDGFLSHTQGTSQSSATVTPQTLHPCDLVSTYDRITKLQSSLEHGHRTSQTD